jgi:hypothetical protein
VHSGLPAYGCRGVNRRLRSLAQLPGGRRSALVLDIGDRVWWPSALTQLAERRRGKPAPKTVAVETKS